MAADTEKLSEQILVNVAPTTFEILEKIRREHDRRLGYVARELMLRGLNLYRRDGKLRDSENGLKVVRVRHEGEITDELQSRNVPAKATAGRTRKAKSAK